LSRSVYVGTAFHGTTLTQIKAANSDVYW
jgi:hypothetical protein